MYEFNEKVDMGLTWVYGSGNAVTLGVARYNSLNLDYYNPGEYYYGEIEYFKGRNGYRMPAYHRLDLSINLKKKKMGKSNMEFWLI